LTSPHNFTLDRKTEKIFSEFQDLARKEHKTVSSLIREFIVDYVESRNPVLELDLGPPVIRVPAYQKLLTQKPIDPCPVDEKGQDAWIKKYPKRTTVSHGK